MNTKRAIGILLLICILAVTVAAVSAQEVTIGDVKFNMPDGFEKVESKCGTIPADDIFEETTYEAYTNGKESVVINVAKTKVDTLSQAMLDEVEKTINGYEGVYNETYKSFTYHTDDGYFVSINGVDPELIEQIIIEKEK